MPLRANNHHSIVVRLVLFLKKRYVQMRNYLGSADRNQLGAVPFIGEKRDTRTRRGLDCELGPLVVQHGLNAQCPPLRHSQNTQYLCGVWRACYYFICIYYTFLVYSHG